MLVGCLGIEITDVAGSFRGAHQAPALLDRLGPPPAADPCLDPSWDFWGATGVPSRLRRGHSVPPLDPALAA